MLSVQTERYTCCMVRKIKDPKAKMRKVTAVMDNLRWVHSHDLLYKMLHKRYQALPSLSV